MSIVGNIQKRINIKFRFLNKHFKNKRFNFLDVGAGNHSASRTKKLFPNCTYYGLDLHKQYSNTDADFALMEDFYELDLTKLDYSSIPDHFFDAILMSHVIEHLHNGDAVLPLLLKKLKPKGVMYIEYPGKKSTKLPSMHGSLNFYDDDTHVRVYTVPELTQIFEANQAQILRSGTRRNYFYIAALPLRILLSFAKGKKLQGNLFWDVLGFAEFLEVKKN